MAAIGYNLLIPLSAGNSEPGTDQFRLHMGANFKTLDFDQFLRQTHILILKILNVWMPVPRNSGMVNPAKAGSPSPAKICGILDLILAKLERFETTSETCFINIYLCFSDFFSLYYLQ